MAPGALFSAGDGDTVQGDGEVCLAAVETDLAGDFRRSVAKGLDLDRAAVLALPAMVALTAERAGLFPENAYRLCSLVVDVGISQTANQHKGVHATMPEWAP